MSGKKSLLIGFLLLLVLFLSATTVYGFSDKVTSVVDNQKGQLAFIIKPKCFEIESINIAEKLKQKNSRVVCTNVVEVLPEK